MTQHFSDNLLAIDEAEVLSSCIICPAAAGFSISRSQAIPSTM